MQITIKNYHDVRRFLEGGEMAAPEQAAPVEEQGAPAPEQAQQDPFELILQAAAVAVQNQDCNTAMQVCQVLLQMAQGQGAEQAPQGEPVYRRGGILSRRIIK